VDSRAFLISLSLRPVFWTRINGSGSRYRAQLLIRTELHGYPRQLTSSQIDLESSWNFLHTLYLYSGQGEPPQLHRQGYRMNPQGSR
jgi:hypothetical protein